MPTINDYIDQLKTDKATLKTNLETQGITGLSDSDTFTELVPEVLNITREGGQVIQYDIVPTASSEYANKIIQYIGTTDATYTNGYFYKCIDNGGLYSWERINVQPKVIPESVTNSNSTYTISSLEGNYSYKLGTITSLTISATVISDFETIIYFTSGSTPTSISMPSSITNIGDAPTMATASSVNTGTCEASKNYIISVINNIAVWKAY